MGLGPCICQHCNVFASWSEKPIPVVRNETTRTAKKFTNWYCKFCGETDPNKYGGFSSDIYEKCHENEKFLRFMLNKKENQT